MNIFAAKHLLVTGATGFLGLRTTSKLLNSTPVAEVAVAVRAATCDEAIQRFNSLIEKHQHLGIHKHMNRVRVIAYDGSDIPIDENTDALLNLGADTSWTKPLDHMMKSNFDPLAKIIDRGSLPKHVIHCSTAFAVPLEATSSDFIALKEAPLPDGKTFFSPYAEAKYLAERKIEESVKLNKDDETAYTIFRPATIGPSMGADGIPLGWDVDMKGLSGLYYLSHPHLPPVKALPGLPGVGRHPSNVIPVDHVANMLVVALHENFSRSADAPSVEYIHATPNLEENLSWKEVLRTYNPDLPVHNEPMSDELSGKSKAVTAAAKVLSLVGNHPFLFGSAKKEVLMAQLTDEELTTFPMSWKHRGDSEVYIKESANTIARTLLSRKKAGRNKATA